MENKKKKKHIGFWIAFPIGFIIIGAILAFYLDLANGPTYFIYVEIVLLVLLALFSILLINSKMRIRLLVWLLFILGTTVVILRSFPRPEVKSAAYYDNPVKTEVMELNDGKVQGVYNKDKTVEIFAGIPYAKPPVGDLRWKEPQDPDKWTDVRDCSKFMPKSMQPTDNALMSSAVDIYAQKAWHPDFKYHPLEPRSEDSLYLNIWKPNTSQTNLPILVFYHGGSLTTGSPSFENYNGEEMAKTNVIMINVAYRLGVFGYFAHPDLINESENHTTGNYGLLDQIKALKWINDNAIKFGGDKNNITIAGESAGSSSVSAICSSPLAKGLFKRAIGESSSLVLPKPPHTYRSMNDALNTGKDIMAEFKCNNISELRNIKAEDLVKTKYSNSSMTLDGYALTKNPYDVYKAKENNEDALLNGYNVLEADAFIIPQYLFSPTNRSNIKERLLKVFPQAITEKIMNLYNPRLTDDNKAFECFNEIMSVYWFIYPHYSWSRMALENNMDVYSYQFTKENGYYGTYHSGEMIYAYGNVKNSPYGYRYNDSDKALSECMLKYWSNFAKSGNPNGNGLTNWSKWDNTHKVFELGSNIGLIDDKYASLFEIMDELMK